MILTRAESDPVRDPGSGGVSFVLIDNGVKVRCVVPVGALNSLGRDCLTNADKVSRLAKHRVLVEAVARRLCQRDDVGPEGVVVTELDLRTTPRR